MIYAQYFILLLIVVGFFRGIYIDINGRPAKEAEGFSGAVVTIISTVIVIIIYYAAGAFSKIF